jgi:quercetin dioxygenase-like cupin family protein
MESSPLEIFHLDKMVKGWFVGDFAPTALRTDAAEVAVKRYKAGEREEAHLHKVATEVTLVLEGTIEMCGRHLSKGDIIKLAPGEATDFTAITDAITVVVKIPSVGGDKFAA